MERTGLKNTFQLKHALMRPTAHSQAKIKLAASPFVSICKFLAAHISSLPCPARVAMPGERERELAKLAPLALSPDTALPASAICATTVRTGGDCPRQTLTMRIFSSSEVHLREALWPILSFSTGKEKKMKPTGFPLSLIGSSLLMSHPICVSALKFLSDVFGIKNKGDNIQQRIISAEYILHLYALPTQSRLARRYRFT